MLLPVFTWGTGRLNPHIRPVDYGGATGLRCCSDHLQTSEIWRREETGLCEDVFHLLTVCGRPIMLFTNRIKPRLFLFFLTLAFGEWHHIHSSMFYALQPSVSCFDSSSYLQTTAVILLWSCFVLTFYRDFVYLYPVAIVQVQRYVHAWVRVSA